MKPEDESNIKKYLEENQIKYESRISKRKDIEGYPIITFYLSAISPENTQAILLALQLPFSSGWSPAKGSWITG